MKIKIPTRIKLALVMLIIAFGITLFKYTV
ncbi:hypothetical protein ACUXKK_005098 [Klebsiella aerogenes]|nr:Uncharacterised protein [Klebsiella pneumoniae]VUT10266.1 hypothetical protein SB6413_05761 [Klebsiella pasteurii]SXV61829.1 Uncharacterised protein [Klebsiella pneumoniae]VCV94692.1 hypothetical protein BANRA_05380 [Klebsiella pneumoniae]VCY08290.1 hypothetical protein BANRA_05378 [Klebsiella pneumoniae]